MELSLEAYRNIVENVNDHPSLAVLCRVSKAFRKLAERALYKTLEVKAARHTMRLCAILSTTPHLAGLVDSFSVEVLRPIESDSDDDDVDDDERGEEEQDQESSETSLPEDYWDILSLALRNLLRLRHLNIHIYVPSVSSNAWILEGCTFLLRTFHCDFNWDPHLFTFLNAQTDLRDLYIGDYSDVNATPTADTPTPTTPGNAATAVPKLSVLECTLIDAAVTFVPGRPIKRLKTCFSRSDLDERRAELEDLYTALTHSTCHLRALDIGDSTYDASFGLDTLTRITQVGFRLRYLGTLILPIDGDEVHLTCNSSVPQLISSCSRDYVSTAC